MTSEGQPLADAVPLPAALPVSRARSGWLAGAIVLTVVHLGILMAHFAPAIMSPDANGYVVQARLIANEGSTSFATASPVQFVGMHWLETQGGVFHSRYPAGLPLLMAAAWKLGGITAALMINPLLASATVLLIFFLARPLAGEAYALLAAAVFATIPVVNQHALDADAHIAATFFLVAGVLALLRFGDGPASVGWGVVAGVLLGIVPTIRYPEAIVGLAIAGWLAWRIRPVWRAWPAAAGAALPLGILLAHNAAAYGAFWRTGYALTNEQTGFGFGYFFSHAIPYLQSLGGQGIALFFGFGAAGLAALAVDRRWRGEGLLYAGIVTPLVLLYMAYYFGGGPGGAAGAGGAGGPGGGAMTGNLRFLVPTFPFFAVAGAWLLSRVARDLGLAGRVAVGVVAALQLLIAGASSAQGLTRSRATLTAAATARSVAQKQIPAGSILIVDRNLAESLDAVGDWRLVEENFVGDMGARGMGMGMGRRPMGGGGPMEGDEDRPSPQQVGKNHAQQERYAGLSPSERRTKVWADLTEWAAGRPIYWFARSVDTVENAIPEGADYESVAEVDAPTMGFGMPGGGPMMGPGGRGPGGMAGMGRGGRGGRGGTGGPGMRGGPFDPTQMGGRRGGMGFGPPGGAGGLAGDGANADGKLRLVKVTLGKT